MNLFDIMVEVSSQHTHVLVT